MDCFAERENSYCVIGFDLIKGLAHLGGLLNQGLDIIVKLRWTTDIGLLVIDALEEQVNDSTATEPAGCLGPVKERSSFWQVEVARLGLDKWMKDWLFRLEGCSQAKQRTEVAVIKDY